MDKLTIGLILAIFILLGAIGYIFASQNTQINPNITIANNSTNDSDYSGSSSDSDYSSSSYSSSSSYNSTKHVNTSTSKGNSSTGSGNSSDKPTKPTKNESAVTT